MTQLARARYRSGNWSNVLTLPSPPLTLARLKWLRAVAVPAVLLLLAAPNSSAQTVTASVNINSTLAAMPDYGMGIHTSVYDNSLRASGSPTFNQLNPLLDAAGVSTLRYPGGGYADVFHFSVSRPGGLLNNGLSPWWGDPNDSRNFGYMGPQTDFGNFVRLLDATNSKAIITVNTGSALKYETSQNRLAVPTHNGQPQEAAAWVAYANANASIYQTPADISLGVDAEGNDWKTAGYWAKLRASTSSEYQSWAQTDGVFDSRNSFLAINRDDPVGIKYWEIGNETFGTNYYGGQPRNTSIPINQDGAYTGYALNYASPYDGTTRNNNPLLSPEAYGDQVNAFDLAMKLVDPTINTGAVLNTPPGDYSWGPTWNDRVMSRKDTTLSMSTVADNVDFVIAHWYPNGTATSILSQPRTTIPPMINGTTSGLDAGNNAGLRDTIQRWRTDANPQALEIFITETDGYGGTTEASDGLFAADMYATFFDHGVTNVDWLELHGGSFLSDANVPNFAFWGAQTVAAMANPGDNLVSTSTSESNVRIHAAKRADGSLAVMLINMNAASGGSRTVNLSINDDELSNTGSRYIFNGDSTPDWSLLDNLGSSFSTTIPGRTLQLFVIDALPPLPGDFNDDGVVDAADYTVWRDNNGTEENYLLWKAHFGESRNGGGSGSSSNVVPEPSAMALLLACIFGQVVTLRRTRASGTH